VQRDRKAPKAIDADAAFFPHTKLQRAGAAAGTSLFQFGDPGSQFFVAWIGHVASRRVLIRERLYNASRVCRRRLALLSKRFALDKIAKLRSEWRKQMRTALPLGCVFLAVMLTAPDKARTQTAPTFVGVRTFLSAPYEPDLDKLNADFAVLGVPFDEGTWGQPGERYGPRDMREDSQE